MQSFQSRFTGINRLNKMEIVSTFELTSFVELPMNLQGGHLI